MENAHAVRELGLAAKAQAATWQMISDLLGGTKTMRAARHRWLPQEERETARAYDNRLSRSVFFNFFKKSARLLASHPFSKPPQISKELAPRLRPWLDDIDLEGTAFDVWALRNFFSAVAFGQAHILVDMPVRPADETSLAAELRNQRRPYFVHLDASRILGFRYEVVNGKPRLVQLRILEVNQEPVGQFGEVETERVRVLYPGAYELWQPRTSNGTTRWEIVGGGEVSLKEIPLVTLCAGEPLGFMQAESSLTDLAWENIGWWQSASDQRHILHTARVPILFASGFQQEDTEGTPFTISPNSLITAPRGTCKPEVCRAFGSRDFCRETGPRRHRTAHGRTRT